MFKFYAGGSHEVAMFFATYDIVESPVIQLKP